MFKNILVPVDGSAAGFAAADKAVSLAKAFDGKVTVICAVDQYPFVGVGGDYAFGQTEYLAAASAGAKEAVAKIASVINASGVPCATKVVEEHVVHEAIIAEAVATGADLIIIGSHGRQGFEKVLLGSVTQRVLARAKIPVLVVRQAVPDKK